MLLFYRRKKIALYSPVYKIYTGDLMTDNNGQTTLRVTKETRNRIARLGEKDDSFDDILETLCGFIEDRMLTEQYEEYLKMKKL